MFIRHSTSILTARCIVISRARHDQLGITDRRPWMDVARLNARGSRGCSHGVMLRIYGRIHSTKCLVLLWREIVVLGVDYKTCDGSCENELLVVDALSVCDQNSR